MPKIIETKYEAEISTEPLFSSARNVSSLIEKQALLMQELSQLMNNVENNVVLTNILNQDEPYRYMALAALKENYGNYRPIIKNTSTRMKIKLGVVKKYNAIDKRFEKINQYAIMESGEISEFPLEQAIILLMVYGKNVKDRFHRQNRPFVELTKAEFANLQLNKK